MQKQIMIKNYLKKEWKTPNLFLLDYKKTKGGETTGTPEDLGYKPEISPN